MSLAVCEVCFHFHNLRRKSFLKFVFFEFVKEREKSEERRAQNGRKLPFTADNNTGVRVKEGEREEGE